MSDASLIAIPLGGGLDESNDDAFVPATRMRMAQNVVFPDTNTCTKRNGVTLLATVANGRRLVKRGDEVLVVDGLNAWSWSPTENALVNRGPVPPCVARQLPIGGSNPAGTSGTELTYYTPPSGGVAQGSGYRIAAWTDQQSVFASVLDLASNTFVRPQEILNAASTQTPKVFVLGTKAIVVYYVPSLGHIVGRSLDLTNVAAGWSGETSLVTGAANTVAVFDASPITGGTNFALVYWLASGATVYGVIVSPAFVQIAAQNLLGTTTSTVFCATVRCLTADNIFVWAVGLVTTAPAQSIYFGSLTADLVTVIKAATVVQSPSGRPTAISIERKYETGAGAFSDFFLTYSWLLTDSGSTYSIVRTATRTGLVSAPGAYTHLDDILAQQMMSKIFCVAINGANHYFWLAMTSDMTHQATSILYHFAGDNSVGSSPNWYPVATLTPDYAAPIASTSSAFPAPSAQDVTFCGDTGESIYTVVGTFVAQNQSVALGMFELDFASTQLWQSVELGRSAYIACGTPMVFDGVNLTEAGFVHPPPQPSATLSNSGGSVPVNTALTYLVCYAQQDALGNVHRSAPCAPIIINNGFSSASITLYITPYKATYRQPFTLAGAPSVHPVTIEVYRNTVANGSVYQLLTVIDNALTSTYVQVTDTSADASIATNPVLYTQQGLVPAVGWPSLTALAIHADRVFGCDADGVTQYYTTALEAGTAPRMADAFTITWPEGPLTASWSLEGRLHAATSKKIHFIYGDGPNDNGASSDFSQPTVWQSDLGVVDSRGVCICQPGVIFWSQKGLYLETRAGEFTWIGERVQRTMGLATGVASIVALDDDGAVRIALEGYANGQNPVLHYDYRKDRWSTFLYALLGGSNAVSAVAAQGTWWGLFANNAVGPFLASESSTSCLDSNTWVTVALVTGWADVAGKQASTRVQRAMLLAASQTPHGITIQTSRDYQSTVDSDSGVWSDADIAAMGFEQMRHTPTQQKCMAMSVSITDSTPTSLPLGLGTGATYRSLMLRTRARRGEWKRTTAGQQR